MNDEDKEAVQKIYTTLSKFVVDTNSSTQILVMEHTDEDVWGDIKSIHLDERWRGNNENPVPIEWID